MRDAGTSPGSARAPGPSLREQLLAAPRRPPWPLLVESPLFLGDAEVPYEVYTSEDWFRAECDHVWSSTWQWACHVDHLVEPGDHHVYDVGPHSALIVRGNDGEIRAFHNSCMHRGTQLKPPGSCGFSSRLTCPFHGWTWSLEGDLVDVPDRWDFPHVAESTHGLSRIPVEIFAGFVWVNFDPAARPLAEHVGVLGEHFTEFDFESRYIETHVRKRLPCNWKAAIEAFLEAYHVRETHSTGQLGDEVTTQYDVFPPNVSRFIHTIGLESPQRPVPRSEDEIFAGLTRGLPSERRPVLPAGRRARDEWADIVRRDLGERYGHDYSEVSESMVLVSIEYFCFPNAFFFPGVSLPMVYRFRPDPDDVDSSIFDLLILRPRPSHGTVPPPPEVVDLGVDDSYTTVPGLGGLGRIYDQDTSNLAAQTRGFRASRKSGQTLGNYQESRARHLQSRVREMLRDGGFGPAA
ncbi:MAG: aromatic ring-hydroxylating oxygenase subunit alpha [Ilumatobacteraceae bacterium]